MREAQDKIRKFIDPANTKEICGTIRVDKVDDHTVFVVYKHHVERLSSPSSVAANSANNVCKLDNSRKKEREFCEYERTNHRIIWHTHPATSKFYPSKEDFVKSLQATNNVKYSYIFTAFGMWTLYTQKKVRIPSFGMYEDIQKALDRLYFATSCGREYKESRVQKMIERINKVLEGHLVISFDPTI